MASLLSVFALLLLYSVSAVFGEYQQVILGDPVTFSATGNCAKEEEARPVYLDRHPSQRVAELQQGVWKPSDYYKDRVISLNSSLVFNYTVYTDTGLYELICGARNDTIIQLDVVLAFEKNVTEGKPAKLQCYYKGESVEAVWWKRNGELVFELNCSSGDIKYGTGFEKRVSVSSDGCKQGDFSISLKEAELKDGGDYFCHVQSNRQKQRGDPVAVRLTINPEQTSPVCPPLNIAIAILVGILVGIVIGIVIGWFLKSHCSNDSPGPRNERDSDVALRLLNSQSASPAQVNACPAV